jgi:hypothetical protein
LNVTAAAWEALAKATLPIQARAALATNRVHAGWKRRRRHSI